MNILAVTCYTGDEELCAMTEQMFLELETLIPNGTRVTFSATAQGADREIRPVTCNFPKNHSFARGINTAIRMGMNESIDYILILNNDLQFPNADWLEQLLLIARKRDDRVIVPATDRAAIRIQAGPQNKPSFDVQEMSAYCWLVPVRFHRHLLRKYGFEMFCEEFVPAYGEDNWTAFLLAKEFGPKVFRYVPRSFVRHLRGKTSRVVDHDRRKTSALLKQKFKKELSDPGLRRGLRRWAEHMVGALN